MKDKQYKIFIPAYMTVMLIAFIIMTATDYVLHQIYMFKLQLQKLANL